MTRPYNPLPTPRPVHRPMAQWPAQRCSQDRFPVKTAILLVGIAFAGVLFAIFPAASDAPASGSTAHVAETGVGRGLPR